MLAAIFTGKHQTVSKMLARDKPGNTKGGSITLPLTSCLTGLYQSLLQIKTKIASCHTVDSKPVKQEVNGTVILPPLVFPGQTVQLISAKRQRGRKKGLQDCNEVHKLASNLAKNCNKFCVIGENGGLIVITLKNIFQVK